MLDFVVPGGKEREKSKGACLASSVVVKIQLALHDLRFGESCTAGCLGTRAGASPEIGEKSANPTLLQGTFWHCRCWRLGAGDCLNTSEDVFEAMSCLVTLLT